MNSSLFRFWFSTSLHLAAVALGARAMTGSAQAQQVYYVNRSTDNGDFQTGEGTSVGGYSGDLRYCLIQSQRYQNPQARTTTTIIIQATPTLTKPLPPWTPNVAQDLTIAGDGGVHTISGGNSARLFFFEAPGSTMTLRDLVLTNGRGKGGDGLDGGGGGAGLGGAVFVGAGVLYSQNVSFTSNAAVGGTAQAGGGGGGGGIGASGGAHSGSGGGGGGGFFGGGGWGGGDCGGGGGGLAWAGNNAANHYGGGGGGLTQAGQPDTRSPGANGGTGGDNADLGGDHYQFVNGLAAPLLGGGGGGGGNGGNGGLSGGNGGAGNKYGGGGGAGPRGSVSGTTSGGNGGEYGGGGGTMADNGGGGGNGGFGGGGGAGQLAGGSGGFGAGHGAKTGSGPIASTAGSGLGGAVFVRSGAGYVFNGGSFSGNTVTAGGGGGGSAQGNGVYMMSGSTFLCNLSLGNYQAIANDIAGDGNLDMQGPGAATLSLSGTNMHTGFTIIENGAVQVQSPASLSPNSILNIWDYGTLDLYGNSLTITPNQLGGSTGTVLNNKPNAPLTLTLNAPADNARDVSVAIADGASPITLIKTGPAPFRFTNFNRASGGLTVNSGTVGLAAGGGFGAMTGSLTITPGTTVNATATNALGFVGGRKVDYVTVNTGTLLHSAPNDQGWGVAYTLNNGAIMDFGSGSDSSSTWSFGGPGPGIAPNNNTSVNATGAAPSEIRGRVTLRPDNGNTACSFTVANGSTLKVPAAIGNPATGTTWPTLYKEGPGLMTFSNTNTYLGNTIVNGGTLELAGYRPGGFGTIVGGITINTGATVKATVTDALGYAPGSKLGGIVINNTGKLLHASPGNQGWGIGYTLNNGGTMDFTTGSDATSAWAFGGPASNPTSVLAVGAAASQIKGRIDMRGDAGATSVGFNVAGDANTTSTLNIPAVILCSSPTAQPTLTKTGNGILVLSGTNTYGGVTNLTGGTLAITNDSALGSGGKIQFTGGTLRFDYAQPQDPSVRFIAPAAGNAVRIDTNGNAVTLTAPIPGAGGLVKLGASTLTLTGAQTYTGGTTISGGTLRLGNGSTLGSLTGNVANAGNLEFAPPGAQSFSGVISGAGSVTKSGTGTLTFTGTQTYTGNTTISIGTLRLGDGTTLGSITGNVANAGTLEFAAPGAQSFGGVISGTGTVTKSGSGTLTLTGAQTYTGNTTISSGTLRLGDGAVLGSLAGNVVNAGTLEFASPSAQSYAGVISGAGSVTKTGTGTLTLTGAQTYTGNTTISSGTLRLGDGTAAGSLAGNVANAGTLEFASSSAQSFGGVISGAGSVTKSGTGTLTLTGAQTYTGDTTISGGTLRLGDGTTQGSIAGNVANAGTLEFAAPGAQSFGGVISGAGGVVKNGPGGLTLTAAQTYTGPTVVSSGSLTVASTASLSSGGVSVASGAELNGGGAINGAVSLSGNLVSTDSVLNGGLTVNESGLATASSGAFTIKGDILNNGTIRVTGGAKFLAGDATTFVNNGVLDLISADPGYTLPANFTNGPNGIVLTRDSLQIKELNLATDGSSASIKINGYTGHTYVLQRSATPGDADFHTLSEVATQDGTTGSELIFTDPAPSASEPFYRLAVAP